MSKRTKISIFALVSLLLIGIVALPGCKKSEPEPTPAIPEGIAAAGGKTIEAAGEVVAAAAVQTTCPIMVGKPIDKAVSTEYNGQKVYFCCPECIDKFKANPEQYIAELPQLK